jgi:hypothetical protein
MCGEGERSYSAKVGYFVIARSAGSAATKQSMSLDRHGERARLAMTTK